jgi:predicted PurR-regulated permease PerM
MTAKKIRHFVLPVVIGFAAGFTVLHPVSMLVVDFFELRRFSIPALITRIVGGEFLSMGVFFAILGGLIGLLFSIHEYGLYKTNLELAHIIESIERHNTNMYERVALKVPRISTAIREMRPALNRIQKLVELITAGNTGNITTRQSTLLSITRGNIDNLFHVTDYLLAMIEKQSVVDGKVRDESFVASS